MASEHREGCGAGERYSERWGHSSAGFLYLSSSKTPRQPGGSSLLNAAQENKALPRLCQPGTPGVNYSPLRLLKGWALGIKLALLFKVNHNLSNTYRLGQGMVFGDSKGLVQEKVQGTSSRRIGEN